MFAQLTLEALIMTIILFVFLFSVYLLVFNYYSTRINRKKDNCQEIFALMSFYKKGYCVFLPFDENVDFHDTYVEMSGERCKIPSSGLNGVVEGGSYICP